MKFDISCSICIVGLGLIGGSYAEALSSKGFEIGAIDLDEESISYALEKGFIKHGMTYPTREYIGNFDILIFALYPHTFIEWIEKNQNMLKYGAIITDVTGVKCGVVNEIQNMLRDDLEFISAHPMAGREVCGIKNASKDIFKDANYIITPTEKNSQMAIDICRSIGEKIGFKTITELTCEKHDEMIAFLSQLTHCIAVSLMTCRDTACLAEYSGDSFRDLTRIAKINDEMWSELFLMNKDILISQMDMFIDTICELRDKISKNDRDAIKKMMRMSTNQRILFDGKEE